MKLSPRFEYNSGVVFALSLAQKFWDYIEGARMGDEDKSAAGIPVSYFVGWEYLSGVTIRFTDDEYVTVMTAIEWIMQNKATPFLYRFDSSDVLTEYSVYLEEPRLTDRVQPLRDSQNPNIWEIRLLLRTSNNVRFNVPVPISE